MEAGSGLPITIQNDTSAASRSTFRGRLTEGKRSPHTVEQLVPLALGAYQVAGELSDKSALPFFGRRSYSDGEIERFYITPY